MRDPVTRTEDDVNRTIPLQCSDDDRQLADVNGKLFTGEVHSTSDNTRLFLSNWIVAPVWHGEINSEAELLALNATSARGCFRADWCFCTYKNDGDGAVAICISGRGTELAQWFFYPVSASGAAVSGYYEPVANGDIDSPENIFAAGDAVVAFVET